MRSCAVKWRINRLTVLIRFCVVTLSASFTRRACATRRECIGPFDRPRAGSSVRKKRGLQDEKWSESPERVPNRQLALYHLPVLHIFRVEHSASRLQRSRCNQGVVDAESVLLRDL